MAFSALTADEIRAAQLFTGAAMALLVSARFVPRLRRAYLLGVTALYLAGIAVFAVYYVLR